MQKRLLFCILFLLPFLLFTSCSKQISNKTVSTVDSVYHGSITAPDFPSGLSWLNTEKLLSLKDLRGKMILLDFWTLGCINCIHIIPDLKKLEDKYRDNLIIIGVHSAKFTSEQGNENIRQAILKNDLEHPVINDKDFTIWDQYQINAWPTTVLIDPLGKILIQYAGEGVFEKYDKFISDALQIYKNENILKSDKIIFALEKNKKTNSLLNFPGKVIADQKNNKLLISDSNNDRILILKLDENGESSVVESIIGDGIRGNKNGNFGEAEFNKPQGLYLSGNGKIIYIADTENNEIRKADLESKIVSTIAGKSLQDNNGKVSDNPENTVLNSPWDITEKGNMLYITMAGNHQIWKMDLNLNKIEPLIGSSEEGLIDGNFNTSSLSQPSGITIRNNKIYFTDPEASAIRTADLVSGKVNTLIGKGLFEFGDKDGEYKSALLQHPLGITFAGDKLFITDTYNNKIKIIDPERKTSHSFSGTGEQGFKDGSNDASFNQPGGMTSIRDKLYIADTNNNLIRILNTLTREVKTLVINNPSMLKETVTRNQSKNIIQENKRELKAGNSKLIFHIKLPAGYKINQQAFPQVKISSEEGLTESKDFEVKTSDDNIELPIILKVGEGNILINLFIYYCQKDNEGICKFKNVSFRLPVHISNSGDGNIILNYEIN